MRKRSVTNHLMCVSLICSTILLGRAMPAVSDTALYAKAADNDYYLRYTYSAIRDSYCEYLYIAEDDTIRAKKEGYYTAYLDKSELYTFDGFSGIGEDAVLTGNAEYAPLEFAAVDDVLLPTYRYDDGTLTIAYSENGSDTDHVIVFQGSADDDFGAIGDWYFNVTGTRKLNTPECQTYSFTASVPYGGLSVCGIDCAETKFHDVVQLGGGNSYTFEYSFFQNGTYVLTFNAPNGDPVTYTVNVTEIDPTGTVHDNLDTEPPELTFNLPDRRGLKLSSDVYEFTVSANEPCTISFESNDYYFDGERSVTLRVLHNGTFTVLAFDELYNSTTEEVKITAFGDGSVELPRNEKEDIPNENPLAQPGGKDSFWEDAANGTFYLDGLPYDGSAKQPDELAFEGGSLLDEKADDRSILPQTGTPAWYATVTGVCTLMIVGGGYALKKGLGKRKAGDGDEQ